MNPATEFPRDVSVPDSRSSPDDLPECGIAGLRHRGVLSRPLAAGERLRVEVVAGVVWATLEGDPQDHVLTAGSRQEFQGPGLWVAESLENEAMLRLERPEER